jgi:hypothetical protein
VDQSHTLGGGLVELCAGLEGSDTAAIADGGGRFALRTLPPFHAFRAVGSTRGRFLRRCSPKVISCAQLRHGRNHLGRRGKRGQQASCCAWQAQNSANSPPRLESRCPLAIGKGGSTPKAPLLLSDIFLLNHLPPLTHHALTHPGGPGLWGFVMHRSAYTPHQLALGLSEDHRSCVCSQIP